MNIFKKQKKGFPYYSSYKEPIGWEDRGAVSSYSTKIKGETIYHTEICNYCNKTVHIGREDGVVFKFCPVCLIKFTKDENKK